jgi:hypothetical protein
VKRGTFTGPIILAAFLFIAVANAQEGNVPPTAVFGRSFMVADFDAADRITNLGSDFGVWNSGKPAPPGKSSEEVDPVGGLNKSGGWRVEYDISTEGSYSGTWLKLQGFDASAYNHLVFFVKNEKSEPVDFIVELKRGPETALDVRRYIVHGVGQEWMKVEIPLEEFHLPSLSSLYELTTVFDGQTTNSRKGKITIDEIQFVQ